jgi:tetratricopeptide (TPR) repeat protein
VGRERELASLLALYDECVADSVARAELVTAPPGVGKTRLMNELVARLRAREAAPAVWRARGDALARDAAFALLAQTMRCAARIGAWEAPDVQRRKLQAHLSETLAGAGAGAGAGANAGVGAGAGADTITSAGAGTGAHAASTTTGELLADLLDLGTIAPSSVPSAVLRKDPRVVGDRMREGWLRWVAAESRTGPIAIVVDDLHWGDAASVKFLDEALRALADRPLFLVALARPEVRDVFPGLWAERDVLDVRLPRLTRRAAEALVGDVLAGASGDVVARIVDRAGGNAFYLEELIRVAAGGGAAATLPDSVLSMVQARFDALAPEARGVLRAGSVFGERFWRGGVAALLGGAGREGEAGALLDDLARRELLVASPESRFPAHPEYAFRHALVRDAAYAMLTAEDRALGHRLAAEWLQSAGPVDDTALAEHFREAEDWPRAYAHALAAGEGAARVCAHPEASKHYASALAALARTPDSNERRRRTVDTLLKRIAVTFTGMTDTSLLDEAVTAVQALPQADVAGTDDRLRWLRLRFYAGRVHFYRGELAEALVAYHEVLAEAPRYGSGDLVAVPAATVGQLLVIRGMFAEAASLLSQAEPALREERFAAEWILNQAYTTIALGMCGRFDEAERELGRGFERAQAMSYPRGLAEMRLAECLVCFARDDGAGTASAAQSAIEHGETAAEGIDIYAGLLFRAVTEGRTGRTEEARATMARAAEVRQSCLGGVTFLADWAAAFDAEIALHAGQLDEAVTHAEAAVRIAEGLGGVFGGGMGHRVLGRALARLGRPDEARVHYDASLQLLAKAGMLPEIARVEAEAG